MQNEKFDKIFEKRENALKEKENLEKQIKETKDMEIALRDEIKELKV